MGKFPLGRLVATPAALRTIVDVSQTLDEFLRHHHDGDRGNLESPELARWIREVCHDRLSHGYELVDRGTKLE